MLPKPLGSPLSVESGKDVFCYIKEGDSTQRQRLVPRWTNQVTTGLKVLVPLPNLQRGEKGCRLNQSMANVLVNYHYVMMPP